jgi:hypothetical protein
MHGATIKIMTDYLKDLGVNGKVLLHIILNRHGGRVCNGYKKFVIGFSKGLL